MSRNRRQRSGRSYLVELIVIAIVIVAIYGWLSGGGPSAFGEWFADRMGAP